MAAIGITIETATALQMLESQHKPTYTQYNRTAWEPCARYGQPAQPNVEHLTTTIECFDSWVAQSNCHRVGQERPRDAPEFSSLAKCCAPFSAKGLLTGTYYLIESQFKRHMYHMCPSVGGYLKATTEGTSATAAAAAIGGSVATAVAASGTSSC